MGNSDTLHRVASVVTPTEEQWQELRQHYKAWRLRFKREGLDDWDADGLSPRGIQGETACGRKGRLGMPGIFSRMGAPRCKRCGRKAGIPDGHGAPFNDKTLDEQQQKA